MLGVAVGEGAHPGHAVQFDLGDPWDPARPSWSASGRSSSGFPGRLIDELALAI
jgi:hypothetical protein